MGIVLPFGLKRSPRILTEVLKPVMSFLRSSFAMLITIYPNTKRPGCLHSQHLPLNWPIARRCMWCDRPDRYHFVKKFLTFVNSQHAVLQSLPAHILQAPHFVLWAEDHHAFSVWTDSNLEMCGAHNSRGEFFQRSWTPQELSSDPHINVLEARVAKEGLASLTVTWGQS